MVDGMGNLILCLGGKRRECSLVELSWRLKLYKQSKAMSARFPIFLDHFHKHLPQVIDEAEWWTTIANGSYTPISASEGCIRSFIHRFIHRLIAFSFSQKKDGDNIPMLDIFFLWCITTQSNFCHLPYCVADFHIDRAGKNRTEVSIYGGMLVTKLAWSYGILDAPKASFF